MFDLTAEQIHWIPVRWSVLMRPASGEGLSVPTETEVELQVELVDRDEVLKLFPNFFATGDEDSKMLDAKEQLRVFKRLVKDWRKVASNGRAVDMTDANIKKLIAVPMFPSAFASAYVQAVGGIVEIREGNSDASRSDGRGAQGQRPATKS